MAVDDKLPVSLVAVNGRSIKTRLAEIPGPVAIDLFAHKVLPLLLFNMIIQELPAHSNQKRIETVGSEAIISALLTQL